MSAVRKSLVAAGMVVIAAASVFVGIRARDQVDISGGPRTAGLGSLWSEGLVASRDPQIERGDFSEIDYFSQMVELLKREYVDPITDEKRLVSGAVRGMVSSLEDPRSIFMDPTSFRAFLNAREGRYEGVGVDLILEMPAQPAVVDPATPGAQPVDPEAASPAANTIPIPNVIVAAVVPGGPADRAGVKVGDRVESVDGHWVLNSDIIERFRTLQRRHSEGKATAEELQEIRREFREKSRTSIMPMKAKEKLEIGTDGTLKIEWVRAGKTLETQIQRAESALPAVRRTGDAIALHFLPNAGQKLAQALPATGPITLDLRNNAFGDMRAMLECMALLAPAGDYGQVIGGGAAKRARPLKLEQGAEQARDVRLIVDGSTRGVAQVFAQALAARGIATIEGKLAGEAGVIEIIRLPDGSGFTLLTGLYEPTQASESASQTKEAA
jgi:C-terminal processing protease CtpA/Prc